MAGRFFAIAVLLLTPAIADAAAFTSAADGNWSDDATWSGSGVPGNGDTVTIGAGHDITVDVNTTIGDSPDPTPANVVTVDTTGTITVATGVTFTIKGCVRMEDGNFTMNAGSTVEFQVPTGLRYWFRTGKAHSDTGKLIINGSSGSRCAFRSSSGAGIAYIDAQGFINNSLIQAEYCDFTLIGDGTEDFAEPYCNSSGADFYLRNCTLTSCGSLDTVTSIDANANFELTNVKCITTVATKTLQLDTAVVPTGGKTRSIVGCSFDKTIDWFSPIGWTVTNTYFGNGYSATDTATGWTLFEDNILVKTAQGPQIIQGDVTDCYWYKISVANPHFLAPSTVRGNAISGVVFEHGGSDAAGDCVVATAAGSAFSYSLSNCIVLPNTADDVSGTLISLLGNANNTWTVNHNTYISKGTAAIAIAETYTGHAGLLASARSNLAWSASATTAVVIQDSSTNDAVANYITVTGYNGIWNGAATLYDVGAGVINTDSTANDVSGDPDFVDETRDLASWDASLGGAGTASAALARIAADPMLIDDCVTWVKAGFVVRNSAYNNAGHDSVTIGAMGYTPASVVSPLSASIPGSGLDPLYRGPVQ